MSFWYSWQTSDTLIPKLAGNSDFENNEAAPSSPTSQLLQEYEMHLRNTLAKGMDAESYSLHTFEALLTQSMENLGKVSIFFVLSIFLFFTKYNTVLSLDLKYFC